MKGYVGRFAPSPTGPLHAGSLVAALASWLDARAHGGQWRVRIEDVDRPRCLPGMAELILGQLQRCGLQPDGPVAWQSRRDGAYTMALQALVDGGRAYPCGCTRKDIDDALLALGVPHERHAERVYPGTCRSGLHGKPARAWRLRTQGEQAAGEIVRWHDRRLGEQVQNVTRDVGDFVLRRADGLWAYQLAVVVDDAWQDITDIVRGEDLADNTPRQILLQQALGVPRPRYLHTPLVLAADGHKLSKQNGAAALDLADPVARLAEAAAVLGLPRLDAPTTAEWLALAVPAWCAAGGGMMRDPETETSNERTSTP